MQSMFQPLGHWLSRTATPAFRPSQLVEIVQNFREPTFVVQEPSGHLGASIGGEAILTNGSTPPQGGLALRAALPPLYPEWLGDRTFLETHGVRYPYVAGAMANGIATTSMVEVMGRAGMLGFFGAAGLALPRVEKAVDQLTRSLGEKHAWGVNLIHSPNEPELERAATQLFIDRGVRRISASAFLGLTKSVVKYAYTGLKIDSEGRIDRQNHVFAKISHPEVARHFMVPAPSEMVADLVATSELTAEEGRLAGHVPVAEDITVESDSGGHTDNRPLAALFPTIVTLRDTLASEHQIARPVRLGAAGGIGTPASVASAFALGAAYVLTGSVNQACIESGLNAAGREMLATAAISDVVMAPAADMFEQGVKVQVLQRGTMFAARARKLYELYRSYDSLEAIPVSEKRQVERSILRATFEEAWSSTRKFWEGRDPSEVERGERDPRHRMALVFRSYLGQASYWAIAGEQNRRVDYQIWCGPAMGAFNSWVEGSFLAEPANRTIVQVALNLLEGGAAVTRAQQLRSYGVPVPPEAFKFSARQIAS